MTSAKITRGQATARENFLRRLDNARVELHRALEEHPGSNELDQVARLVLQAVRSIAAARREALRSGGAGDLPGGVHAGDHRHDAARDGDRRPDRPEL